MLDKEKWLFNTNKDVGGKFSREHSVFNETSDNGLVECSGQRDVK